VWKNEKRWDEGFMRGSQKKGRGSWQYWGPKEYPLRLNRLGAPQKRDGVRDGEEELCKERKDSWPPGESWLQREGI